MPVLTALNGTPFPICKPQVLFRSTDRSGILKGFIGASKPNWTDFENAQQSTALVYSTWQLMRLETLWKYFENLPNPYVWTILCPLQQLPFQLLSSWAVSSCWFLLASLCHETSVSLESSVCQGGGIQVHILQFCHVLMFFHSLVHPWHFTDIAWLLPRMISWTYHGAKSWCISQIMFGATAPGQETWTEELTLLVALIYKEVLVRLRHELGKGKGVWETGQDQDKEPWDIYSVSLNLAAIVLYERLSLKSQLYFYFPFLPVLPTCAHSCTPSAKWVQPKPSRDPAMEGNRTGVHKLKNNINLYENNVEIQWVKGISELEGPVFVNREFLTHGRRWGVR